MPSLVTQNATTLPQSPRLILRKRPAKETRPCALSGSWSGRREKRQMSPPNKSPANAGAARGRAARIQLARTVAANYPMTCSSCNADFCCMCKVIWRQVCWHFESSKPLHLDTCPVKGRRERSSKSRLDFSIYAAGWDVDSGC